MRSLGETPLSHSFCQYVVTREAPLVVTDAREDQLVQNNGAVADLGVISYLGVPLRTPDGHTIGYEHTFVNHLADFVTALAGKKPFAPDFDDGVAVQAVLEAAQQSAEKGAWVKVPR